jgi:tetratricopeptide (TPR) repeat protein
LADSWSDCSIQDFDRAIRACTDVITNGHATNHKLALAYRNRCAAYADKHSYDEAIIDCDKAIELDPKYAGAYYNRGVANGRKGVHVIGGKAAWRGL